MTLADSLTTIRRLIDDHRRQIRRLEIELDMHLRVQHGQPYSEINLSHAEERAWARQAYQEALAKQTIQQEEKP